MAGKSSNLGASSSSSTSKKTAKKQQEKRKQCATRADEAKKQRPFQLTNFTARSSATAVVPFHLRGAPSSRSTASPFPIAGVNGAAPRWSTAATLRRAASRATATAALPPPATAGANGPAAAPFVLAPAPSLQPPGAVAATNAAAALLAPLMASATGVRRAPAPLVVAQAGATGQLVPLPLHFVGYHYHSMGPGLVLSGLPAPVIGIPLAAALDKIENITLGRMLTALMPVCHPPLWHHQNRKSGTPPPWWPTGSEHWWGPELLAHSHLDTVAVLKRTPTTPVPFAPSYSLKKAQKVAVLVAIVKHLAPDFARIADAVSHSGKLSVSETELWHSALNNERAKCMRPVFILLPQPQPQQQAGGGSGRAGTDRSAGSVVVHSGNAASGGWEQVAIANLHAAGASVSTSADVSRGEVIAAAELQVEKEQRSDVDGGVVLEPAADAPAGIGRDQTVVNFPAGYGSTPKQLAVPPTGHARQVAAEPEMMMQQPEEQHGAGVPGGDVAAAAEDDQVQVHPPVFDVAEEEGHQWWLNEEELGRMLAEFESFGDVSF